MRVAVLAGLVLLAWAIPGLTRHLGGRSSTALWLTVANPLVVALGIGGAHNDVLMVGLMAAGVLMVLDRKHLRGFALIALIALATAVKATALLVVVFAAATVVAGVDLGWISVLRSQGPLLTWMSLPCAAAELLYFSIGRYVPGFTTSASSASSARPVWSCWSACSCGSGGWHGRAVWKR
jgi:alpha-1,6-mannosyltransferase